MTDKPSLPLALQQQCLQNALADRLRGFCVLPDHRALRRDAARYRHQQLGLTESPSAPGMLTDGVPECKGIPQCTNIPPASNLEPAAVSGTKLSNNYIFSDSEDSTPMSEGDYIFSDFQPAQHSTPTGADSGVNNVNTRIEAPIEPPKFLEIHTTENPKDSRPIGRPKLRIAGKKRPSDYWRAIEEITPSTTEAFGAAYGWRDRKIAAEHHSESATITPEEDHASRVLVAWEALSGNYNRFSLQAFHEALAGYEELL